MSRSRSPYLASALRGTHKNVTTFRSTLPMTWLESTGTYAWPTGPRLGGARRFALLDWHFSQCTLSPSLVSAPISFELLVWCQASPSSFAFRSLPTTSTHSINVAVTHLRNDTTVLGPKLIFVTGFVIFDLRFLCVGRYYLYMNIRIERFLFLTFRNIHIQNTRISFSTNIPPGSCTIK